MKPYLCHQIIRGLGLVAAAFITTNVRAGTLTMNWTAAAGGGALAAGGRFSLGGTIGQPAPGPSSGPNCSLAAGFWATEYPVIQTPGAPRLTLTRSGTNVILSWPSSASGFSLQISGDLQSWETWPQSPVLVGDQYQVRAGTLAPRLYFRLIGP